MEVAVPVVTPTIAAMRDMPASPAGDSPQRVKTAFR